MEHLSDDNTAAIVEALRSEKWSGQLFPLYISHQNHMVRYEIACSSLATDSDLKALTKDGEMIVRQAALQNLLSRANKLSFEKSLSEAATASPQEEKSEPNQNNEKSNEKKTSKSKKEKTKKSKKDKK